MQNSNSRRDRSTSMKRIFLLMFCIIIVGASVQASISHLGIFERGECVELKQTCPDCTYNNISKVSYPNSSVALSEVAMNKFDTFYNYSFCDTNTIGVYKVDGYGDLGGTLDTWNYELEITPTGDNLSISQSVLYVIFLLGCFVLVVFFVYLSISLPYSNQTDKNGAITRITKAKYLKLFSIWIAYGFIVLFLSILTGIFNNYIFLETYSNLLTNMYLVMYGFNYVLTFGLLFVVTVEVWRDILINNELKKYGKALINGK